MPITKEQVVQWYEAGKEMKATHMIIVCDTYDYDDFPIYVSPNENARDKAKSEAAKPMQKVMEVYSLALPVGDQYLETRAFHYD